MDLENLNIDEINAETAGKFIEENGADAVLKGLLQAKQAEKSKTVALKERDDTIAELKKPKKGANVVSEDLIKEMVRAELGQTTQEQLVKEIEEKNERFKKENPRVNVDAVEEFATKHNMPEYSEAIKYMGAVSPDTAYVSSKDTHQALDTSKKLDEDSAKLVAKALGKDVKDVIETSKTVLR